MNRQALLGTVLAVAAGPSLLGQTPLPSSTLPMQLTGVVFDSVTPSRSACLLRCLTSPERRGIFYTGDRACDVAEIREVRQDGVVVENLATRRVEFMTFTPGASRPPEPPAPTTRAASAAAPAVASVEVPRATIERHLANLPDVLASALATQRYRDGAGGQRVVDGFEVTQVRSGGVAEQVGLRDGDVITEVNGQPLDGMPTVLRLFGEVSSMTEVKMTVLRRGQVLTLVVTTK
jgi:type II secretory pathway component PulC